MMKKKIMFFIPRMGGGGAERVVANLANRFAADGNEVTIYTPTDTISSYELDSRINFESANLQISKKSGVRQVLMLINGIILYFKYSKKIKEIKPDNVISFLTQTNLIALFHKHKNYRLIVSERNDPSQYPWLIQVIIKKVYIKSDILVCQSNIAAKFFKTDNTVIIPNPINVSELPVPYEGERVKEIVAVGRLMKQKNFHLLITAFSGISKDFPEYVLRIFGDGVLRRELQNLINSLGVCERVFLEGYKKNVIDEYKKASVFVMSSDYEGYPNALVEAMAMGLPVICTDFASGTAKELIDKKNGILVPCNNVEEMEKALRKMLSDTSSLQKMGLENTKVRKYLDIDKVIKKWYAIL